MCVLAGTVTFVSIILLAVYPESLRGDTLRIYPNTTILAVPDGGLDPSRINYVLYQYYYRVEEQQQNIDDRLSLYKIHCNDLKPESRVVDIDKTFNLPESVSIVELDHLYLLKGSSIMYQINMTLLSEVPTHCYATLVLNDQSSGEEGVEICNTTAGTLSVTATSDSYISPLLTVTSDAKLKTIHMRVNGTVYYYDALQSNAELACETDPPTNTRCSIPIRDITGNLNKICILAERESSSGAFEFSEFEYYMASFDYVQVILITLICVGLVSFVCMCGLSISLCTKPGRRLRQALHMSSPLSN